MPIVIRNAGRRGRSNSQGRASNMLIAINGSMLITVYETGRLLDMYNRTDDADKRDSQSGPIKLLGTLQFL